MEVGGDWTCHRHVPECRQHEGGKSERGCPCLVWQRSGGPPLKFFEILDGRRCNLGIYLRKMKLLIGLKNAGFFRVNFCSSQKEIEEIQATVKMPQN